MKSLWATNRRRRSLGWAEFSLLDAVDATQEAVRATGTDAAAVVRPGGPRRAAGLRKRGA